MCLCISSTNHLPNSFFTTFVNPIGIDSISWKYLLMYVCLLVFENIFVFLFFPETANKTLEELTFLFEDQELADRATRAVEKAVQHRQTPAWERGFTWTTIVSGSRRG